jgi:16S rRNA (guanine527-N7)-methyltransferase
MLVTHLLDCLAVVQPLRRQLGEMPPAGAPRLLDVGSGAGLPGLALAVCLPQLQVTCIDTVAKKAAFIQQAGLQLGLKNLKAVHGRVEKHAGQYDVVCSRAFASLADFVSWTRGCVAPKGVWMAMKGKQPQDEINVLEKVDVFHVEPLAVPGLQAERCVVWMRPS